MLKFFFMFFITVSICFSHPHLFITPSAAVIISNSVVEGVRIIWKWDKWWSSDVMSECDKNKDGKLDSNEIKLVYQDYFSGIEDLNFFTEVYVNGKKVKIKKVLDFSVSVLEDNLVEYVFVIPLDIPIESKVEMEIVFNDESIYTAFDKKVNISSSSGVIKNPKLSPVGYYGVKVIFDIILN